MPQGWLELGARSRNRPSIPVTGLCLIKKPLLSSKELGVVVHML